MLRLVTATEFLLGDVFWDPTGTGERTEDGKARWAVDGNLAVTVQGSKWSGKGPLPELELESWAEHLAVRAGIVTSPEQLVRLEQIFPGRVVRPFQRYGTACFGASAPRNLIAVTLDVGQPPERWRTSDWRNAYGERLDLTGTDPTIPGALVPWTIRDLLVAWRSAGDPSLVEVEPSEGILLVGVCKPRQIDSDADHLEPVGKDGDQLAYYLTDPLSDPIEGLTVYRKVDAWPPVQAVAATLGTSELLRRTGLSESTARAVVRNAKVSDRTKQIVAEALRYVGDVAYRRCPRVECPRRLRPRQRYCSTTCRDLVESAEYQLWLHEQGAVQCRNCKAIRWGDLTGPCPNCGKPRGRVAR